MKEKVKIWLNRIFSFLFGGLVILIVINASVVSNVKKQNTELQKELNKVTELLNEATVLLNDAKAFFENNRYDRAKERLDTLFEKHPGSNEAAEGKKIYTEVQELIKKEQNKQEEMDKKWEVAVGAIQEKWQKEKAAQLREQFEKEINDTLDEEWEKGKEKIREEWEEQ